MTDHIIASYLEAIFYKYQLELKARLLDLQPVMGISYNQFQQQPWPRSFDYSLEFFAADEAPPLVDGKINAYLNASSQEYILNVLSNNLSNLIPGYRDIGYQLAWKNNIMQLRLRSKHAKETSGKDIEILPINCIEHVAMINALGPEYPTSIQSVDDPAFINLMAIYQGQIGAKAQAIILDTQIMVISDMFTSPIFRRRGLSAALLLQLHAIGLERGCKNSILVPSKMTRDIELYQKFLYTEAVSIGLFVPPARRDE